MLGTDYSCQILMTLQLSRQILQKYSNIKFHENPSIGSWVFHQDRHAEMTEPVVALRTFTNVPKESVIREK